jgi:hypothetical protein
LPGRNNRKPSVKIQTIEITNYKAFYGTHRIDLGGKNLFIYGKNGIRVLLYNFFIKSEFFTL